MIPSNLQKYFWDTDPAKVDTKKHKQYILERLLEIGDNEAANWLQKTFSKKDIIETIKKSRKISAKSANFWSLILCGRKH